MAEYNPLAAGAANADDSQRRMLEAVAQAGTAGRKAFESAQVEQQSAQQAAIQRAQERQNLVGLSGVGSEAGIQDTFGRYGSALTGTRAAYEQGLEGTKASGTSYFEKLKGAGNILGQINQGKIDMRDKEIQAALAQAQAEAEAAAAAKQADRDFQLQRDQYRENAANERANRSDAKAAKAQADKFPLKEVIGRTEQQLPGVVAARDKAGQDIAALQQKSQVWQTGSNLKPIQDQIAALDKKLKDIGDLTGGGIKGGLKTLQSVFPGGRKAVFGDKEIKQLKQQQTSLQQQRSQLDQQLRATKEYNKSQMATSSTELARLQTEYDAANALSTPTALSRYIGQNDFGRGADETYGNLTDNTWAPILNAVAANDKRVLPEQTVALAKKTNINGGAKMVQEILNKKDVSKFIQDAQNLAAGGTYTWEQITQDMKKDYQAKGQDRTYAVLQELLKGYDWPKAAK